MAVAEPWVINASPIILLAKAGVMDFVLQLAQPLVIPEPVAEEVRQGAASDAGARWIHSTGKSFIQPPVGEPGHFAALDIGAGERSVIAWAMAHSEFAAILDDQAARRQARREGVRVLGTIGVVLRLKAAGHIERVEPCLMTIRRVGGHISETLFREALAHAGEI